MNSLRASMDFDNFMECSSIAASTEEILWSDDDTIVPEQEQIWHNDLAAIRKLLDTEHSTSTCLSCNMPFDKGKKRRLIDNCGHEICYSCMFTNESCPLCNETKIGIRTPDKSGSLQRDERPSYGKMKTRSKNHLVDIIKSSQPNILNPEKLPKPVTNAKRTSKQDVMTQSCPTPTQARRKFLFSPKALRSPFSSRQTPSNDCSSDSEDGQMKKNPTQNDMYMRLGLLLGEGAKNPKINGAADSTYNIPSIVSTNTSPISTLTGSSEDPYGNNYGSESMGSLLSVSMSSESNRSFSPIRRRTGCQTVHNYERHTTSNMLNRRFGKTRIGNSQLTLKPLFFEVPAHESDSLFIGRDWLFCDMNRILSSSSPGVVITGRPGAGKTAIILQLVEFSCFGRRKMHMYPNSDSKTLSPDRCGSPQSIYCQIDASSDTVKSLASNVVAYHFCQADNNNTCLVPDFIHSIAAQLCQTHQLIAYRDHLLSEPNLQEILSIQQCISNPDLALTKGILEPLNYLKSIGKIPTASCLILIDAVCEAEYHRPDYGDTIISFLVKHLPTFPSWLKFVITVRAELYYVCKNLPFKPISLDGDCENTNYQKDILEYITFRMTNSPIIQTNICSDKAMTPTVASQKFSQHLLGLSQGSFLFTKLTLDLLERGYLVIKSSRYKVLPVSLAQIYLLHFNLRFPTIRSFEKVSHILSVCLAALYPLTLLEIYYSVNSLFVDKLLPWGEFLQRFKLLSGFLVRRLDNTYMFFHPSFREWLIRRDEGENAKFLCDLRSGHAGIAFRLSRVQTCLDAEKTLEFGHHILKAHLYRNMSFQTISSRDLQAFWIAETSENISDAICSLRNVHYPNVKVSRLLFLAGADPNYVTTFLKNAPLLCVFSNEGIVPMVSLLLEFGANVELANEEGYTPLIYASIKGHCDVVRQLIAAGASPGRSDTSGTCALVHAAKNGNFNIVTYLLACDWYESATNDVKVLDAANQALVEAAGENYVNIVEYLLDMTEANVDYINGIGESALTLASAHGCQAACISLIHRGADISMFNRNKMSPILMAAKEGHRTIAEFLIVNSANIEDCDSNGRTPLTLAAMEGHITILELLLDKCVNIEHQDSEGLTALCWACVRGRQQAIISLLERGANINHSDKTGRTPLDLASFQGNPASVQILLEKGAVIEHVDINGMRPLDRAIGNGNINVVQCFLKKGAKLGPATWTMASDKPEIMLILLNKLLEDGNILYHKKRLREASHRYQYALKKFPTEVNAEFNNSFELLKINFLLNYSRCKRKLHEVEEAIELANQVLALKPNAYEAFYARSKAKLDLKLYQEALQDIQEAIQLSPQQNIEVTRTLHFIKEEIIKKISNN